MLGILKAYTTRVGSGPFPTELFDEMGEYLSKTGGEFGVTTGRRRRCGWFDAVIARYATRVNGITDYFLTKLDVLSSLETVPICVGYTVNGKRTDDMPMTQSEIAHRRADLRGDAGLVGGHLRGPRVRRPARQGARLRAAAGRACRRPYFVHRRRTRPGADDRAPRHSGRAGERSDPRLVDPDYDRHGGFPNFEAAQPGPGFGRFLTAMRRTQDLAVSADPDSDTWNEAADRAEELVKLLDPFEAPEGVGPANRVPALPGSGSLLMPPYRVTKFESDGVELTVQFSRYHVGGNYAVHGGVLPLMFDSMFGMVIHASGRPISRTGFLHVDYRKVTPIDTPLTMRGWVDTTEGRKAFVNAELRDPDDNLLAEANGLMIRLLPGQP